MVITEIMQNAAQKGHLLGDLININYSTLLILKMKKKTQNFAFHCVKGKKHVPSERMFIVNMFIAASCCKI